jgi:preprotein translocase subunit SecG
MEFLYATLFVIHVLICLALIIVVLLQSSKGEGLAGAFGGGGLSGAVFGGRGAATFLSKATSVLAICFMVSSLTLAVISIYIRGGGGANTGVIENLKTNTSQPISTPSSTLPGETQQGTTPPAATPGDSGK